MNGEDSSDGYDHTLAGILVILCGTILPLVGGYSIIYLSQFLKHMLFVVLTAVGIFLFILLISVVGRIAGRLYNWD